MQTIKKQLLREMKLCQDRTNAQVPWHYTWQQALECVRMGDFKLDLSGEVVSMLILNG